MNSYQEALKGAFLLRLIFFGKEYTEAFTNELNIIEDVLNKLDTSIKKFIVSSNEKSLVKELSILDISPKLTIKLINLISSKKHLI